MQTNVRRPVNFLSDYFLQAKSGNTIITYGKLFNNAAVGAVESYNFNMHQFCEPCEQICQKFSSLVYGFDWLLDEGRWSWHLTKSSGFLVTTLWLHFFMISITN